MLYERIAGSIKSMAPLSFETDDGRKERRKDGGGSGSGGGGGGGENAVEGGAVSPGGDCGSALRRAGFTNKRGTQQ